MTISRHHAEWLSLVETSGPFLSLPVLLRVFPQGLEARDPAKASRLREAYEDWRERGAKQPAVHHAWIRHVLADLLEYPLALLAEGQGMPPGLEAVMASHGETLRPDYALKHRDAGQKPVLLIAHYAPDQDLEKAVAGKAWKATPGTRMMELLHATDIPLGLVTNGEQWMVVHAPRGETTGFASWYADLWLQEPVTLRAFHSLLHLRRFLGVAQPETLAALYAESSKDQQEVTDQLGYQVRRAVEMLVQAFDRIDAESGRTLLAGVREKDLYDSALTIMMRLVFLFSADERGLLLLGDPLYDQHYAVSTLSAQLRQRASDHGEEILERRHDAWCRLLATFRAVHGGVEHEALRLPPYGGTLFDPDRYPFLEGRAADTRWRTTPAKPLPINNRVVLHLLESLQQLRVKVPGGGPAETRRLSFRALDIEQIGHVYEGLLDHTARRASEVILGLAGAKDSEPEIPLAKLEELAAKDRAALLAFLKEETGRSERALGKLLEKPELADDHALLLACSQDPRLAGRVRPFAALLREDDFGQRVVIAAGSVYVTAGSDRRSTGTHYTPRSLTEPIVQHTLDPLVYTGPAEGQPQAAWKLKSPREILALKVCDLAMGSGAFLVQACRYLAERLVEAWEQAERAANETERGGVAETSRSTPERADDSDKSARPDTGEAAAAGASHTAALPGKRFLVTPEGDLSTGSPAERLLPTEADERLAIARRYVADRCLYGVDINPMAVEMAKLSLWLITLQRDRPFTFLDHALKCGDSLLGVSSVRQIENFSLRPGERQVTFATANLFRYVDEAAAKRRELESRPSDDFADIEEKNRLHAEAEAATAKVKAVADCLIALELRGLDGDAYEDQRTAEAEKVQLLMKRDADASMNLPNSHLPTAISQLAAHAREQLHGRRAFHWAVEFPEVFDRGGFDAFVGNPPFMGGLKITGIVGVDYREFLVRHMAGGKRGSADLSSYFLLKGCQLLLNDGCLGLLTTNTVAQGDSREVALDPLENLGFTIFRAISSRNWPGIATVFFAALWIKKGKWSANFILNDCDVQRITPSLTPVGQVAGRPQQLVGNSGQSFIGSIVLGMGFVLTKCEADTFIRRNEQNKEVIYPYLVGEDFNADPKQANSRWVICFFDWPLSRGSDAKCLGPVAEDYPECLTRIENLVKPEREARCDRNTTARDRSKHWWRFGRLSKELLRSVKGKERVLAVSLITNHIAFAFVPSNWIYAHKLCIVPTDRVSDWAVLQSSFHYCWAWNYSSTNLSLLNYSPSDCFETFPFPSDSSCLGEVAERLYQYRAATMISRQEGLTKTYNRFHDRGEQSADITQLRALHVEMDQAVAAAYGWSDLVLGHGFHTAKQGERYTISEPARRTVLDRLLALNHQRYAEEVKAGLHDKGAKKKGKPGKSPAGAALQAELIPPPQQELFG